ncbi:MAG: FAD binding domain-containing protein [Synergistaceae bacterium]|jgi:carbon-monoxide dehydrogenase small subunit/xanthine dehydrogenase small subunit|nr:FAD binding domain-containing protein [Synergistaceae bacterium]
MKIELTVNGSLRTVETHPMTRLLDLLRDEMRLKGCKEGCGEGECGACAVIMDGRLINACMVSSLQAAGSHILTIEGLGSSENPDALQTAFVEEGAVHCGFCTPGMIMAARALLQRHEKPNEKPSLEDVRVALSGNLCRCTGYNRIYAAVERAVAEGYKPRWEDAPRGPRPVFSSAEKDCFFSPGSLKEALEIFADHPNLLLLAGGTDTGPDVKNGKIEVSGAMDIFGLQELKTIERRKSEEGRDEYICCGACVTDAELAESPLIAECLPALREAALLSAAPAIRNRATVGGNLCTASGAADMPVALLALGGRVRLQSKGGERVLNVEEFIKGYRKTDLRSGELLREFIVPVPNAAVTQKFYKRGSRAALTLSRASLAFVAEIETQAKAKAKAKENGGERSIINFRAAAGSMSPIPTRLRQLESVLVGQPLVPELISRAVETVKSELNPRKSAAYRKDLAGNLTRRFLEDLIY